MTHSAKILAAFFLFCACNTPTQYWTEEACPVGDEGWKTCFAGCASPELRTLSTNDPDDYVYACSEACEKACSKMSLRVRNSGNYQGVPCPMSKGAANIACKRAGWRP